MTADLHHLAAAYALDALDGPERAAFEAHYPTCEICRQEVEQFRETAGLLASATAEAPPDHLERSVLDEISRTRQLSPITGGVIDLDERRRRSTPALWLASAAAVVVLVVGAVAVTGFRGGPSAVEDVLAAPDAIATTLDLTPDGDTGTFQVVWSAERDRVAVIANGLPDPGPGRVYELWAIVDDTPVPAGLFEPTDGSLRAATEIDDVEAVAWGVTVEPSGGSDAPTTPTLFYAEA